MILFSTQPPRTASRSLPIPVVGIRAEDDAARLLDRLCTKVEDQPLWRRPAPAPPSARDCSLTRTLSLLNRTDVEGVRTEIWSDSVHDEWFDFGK